MLKRKRASQRGKLSLSKYFQEFDEGDKASLVREHSLKAEFPERFQGRTGVVIGKRGNSYILKIKDHNKEKTFIVRPIHLKKLNA